MTSTDSTTDTPSTVTVAGTPQRRGFGVDVGGSGIKGGIVDMDTGLLIGDRIKLLWWDRDGLTLYYRRLEEGTFRFPTSDDPEARSIEVSTQELSLVLWGIDLTSVKRQQRYQRAG